jgi:hypothetical protein
MSSAVPVPADAGVPFGLDDDRAVEFFRQHGWWVSGKILPDDLLDAAAGGIARYRRGERDWMLPPEAAHFDWVPEQGEKLLQQNGYLTLQNREVATLVRFPLLAGLAAKLLQVDSIRLFHGTGLAYRSCILEDL